MFRLTILSWFYCYLARYLACPVFWILIHLWDFTWFLCKLNNLSSSFILSFIYMNTLEQKWNFNFRTPAKSCLWDSIHHHIHIRSCRDILDYRIAQQASISCSELSSTAYIIAFIHSNFYLHCNLCVWLGYI